MIDFKPLFEQIKQSLNELFDIPDSGSMPVRIHQIKRYIEHAETYLEYDPNGFTSVSHLEGKWKEVKSNVNFSLDDLLNGSPALLKYQQSGLSINKLFSNKDFIDEKKYFIKVVRDGLKHYGAEKEVSVDDMLLARCDSLNSFKKLSKSQFLRGEYSSAPPSYVKQIYEWWNVNSLLKFAVTLPNSVSMHLIRSPNLYEIYFCFVIKNGANIYILTDNNDHSNPLYHQMTRRPDRGLARKIAGHNFPYYLMDVGSKDGELYKIKKEDLGNALAPYQKDTKIIAKVDELEESCLAWTILMFNLIQQNYFLRQVELPKLSYTAEMMQKPDILIEHAKKNGLVLHQDIKYFERNSTASISTENIDHAALGKEVTTCWMEKRYGHLVNEETLNLIAPVENNFELNTVTNSIDIDPKGYFREKTHIELRKSSTSDFGEAEQLERNHIFRARANYVSIIQDMAKKEFDREEKAMDLWFKKLVDSKTDVVMDACKAVKNGYTLTKSRDGSLNYERNGTQLVFNGMDISKVAILGERSNVTEYHLRWWPKHHIGQQAGKCKDYECCMSGKKAFYGIGFMFRDIDQLVNLFGISIEDVPEFMRFYESRSYRSQGNHILDRIDPMANIRNPFNQYKLSILVLFSKSELKNFGLKS